MKKRLLALILSCCMVPLAFKTDDIDNAMAANKQLNVVTTFDISETATYGVPTAFFARFSNTKANVISFYSCIAGININFTVPSTNYVIRSCAYECRYNYGNNNMDSFCLHVSNAYCNNSGPYHCTNCGVIRTDVFAYPRNNDHIDLCLMAVRLCSVSSSGNHNSLNGIAYTNDLALIVRDTDYTKSYYSNNSTDVAHASATIIHEIGHLYGVSDHYNTYYGTDRDYCIWGYYHNTFDVASNEEVCDVCKNIIQQNASRFNHS